MQKAQTFWAFLVFKVWLFVRESADYASVINGKEICTHPRGNAREYRGNAQEYKQLIL